MKRFVFPLLSFLALAACNDVSVPQSPPPSFRHFQPIYMKVSNIEVVEEYQSPLREPNVEHLMQYSPADAMQIWVKHRLKANGGPYTMQVIIKDASVVGKGLPTKGGLSGLLTSEVDQQYNARIEVEMRIYGAAALSEASINVVGNRVLTLTENASAHERELKLRAMLNDLMTSMNAEMEKNIFQYLGPYVNYAMNP